MFPKANEPVTRKIDSITAGAPRSNADKAVVKEIMSHYFPSWVSTCGFKACEAPLAVAFYFWGMCYWEIIVARSVFWTKHVPPSLLMKPEELYMSLGKQSVRDPCGEVKAVYAAYREMLEMEAQQTQGKDEQEDEEEQDQMQTEMATQKGCVDEEVDAILYNF